MQSNSEAETKAVSKSPSIWFVTTWVVMILFSFGGLWWYKTRPGPINFSKLEWPAAAKIQLSPRPLTLVMFLHPKCECSDASIHELREVMVKAGDRLEALVLFYHPSKSTEDWTHTALWDKASALPATRVLADRGGETAFEFGARTSGQTFLFNSQGKAIFLGGITDSRGHIGDNLGRRTIASIVAGEQTSGPFTRPFGCALFSAQEMADLQRSKGNP